MYNYEDVLNLNAIQNLTNVSNQTSFFKYTETYHYFIKAILQIECVKNKVDIVDTMKIMNRYNSYDFFYMNFDEFSKDLEKRMFEKLNIPFNLKTNKKQDVIFMLKSVLNEYYRELNMLIVPYNKEELFMLFYSCASSFSHIMTYANLHNGSTIEDDEDIAKTIMNENIDLAILLTNKNPATSSFLSAKEKSKFDFIIHYLSCKELSYRNKNISDLNFEKLFFLLQNIVEVIMFIQTVKQEKGDNSFITITASSILIDEGMNDYLNSYFSDLSKEFEKISPKHTAQLMREFENRNGYSPEMFMKYIGNVNKKLNFLATFNLVEDRFLIYDLCKVLGITQKVALDLIENFKLKRVDIRNLEQTVSGKTNRVFRNPIIQIGNYLLLSNDLLLEACCLFEKRILKGDISKPNGKFNNMVKSLYDEEDLEELARFISDMNLKGDINCDLQRNIFLKDIVFFTGETAELDFYMIFKNTLYIMEYKNWDSERTLSDIAKINNKAKQVIKKMIKTRDKITGNKQNFINAFGEDFSEIKLFLSFKYPLSCIKKIENIDVELFLYTDFFDYIQTIVN